MTKPDTGGRGEGRSSDLVMVEREVLEPFIRAADSVCHAWMDNEIQWALAPGVFVTLGHLRALRSALQSVEGGVQGSPELRLRVALAIERADNVKVPDNYAAEIDHPEISDWNVYLADRAIEAMKSAPLIGAPHNSGGRLPIDKAESGADTKSEGGVQGRIATKQESCPESPPRTEMAGAIYSALSSACIEHSALSVSGFNLFGDSKSIKAAQEWLHSHNQIGDLKTNLRHWRDECGKLHAKLTKTPSADHDAGNLTGGDDDVRAAFDAWANEIDPECKMDVYEITRHWQKANLAARAAAKGSQP